MAEEKQKTESVREAFVRKIENSILSGDLKIGDRLPPARELCKEMGVSLTIVNTGVRELVSKGFLDVKPRHGMYVADYRKAGSAETLTALLRFNGDKLSGKTARAFLEVRIALDPFVIGLAIDRADDEQLAGLKRYADALDAESDEHRAGAIVTDFFAAIAALSENPVMAIIFASTFEAQKYVYDLFISKNGIEPIRETVRVTCEKIRARDKDGARFYATAGLRLAIEGKTAIFDEKSE